jgi:hypothetical protein
MKDPNDRPFLEGATSMVLMVAQRNFKCGPGTVPNGSLRDALGEEFAFRSPHPTVKGEPCRMR